MALIRGGKLSRLASLSIRHWWALATAVALRLALHYLAGSNLLSHTTAMVLNLLSHGMLILVCAANLENLPGFSWVLIGVFSNAWVIFVNGGRMPISPTALASVGLDKIPEYQLLAQGTSFTHQLANRATRLAFLGDVIPVPLPFLQPVVVSPGDVAICLGGFILIQWLMLCRQEKRN
ncbi:MAG: DUF5317 domain-containing protein [Bacillota bacterium]